MKKLLELEERLKEAKENLEKALFFGGERSGKNIDEKKREMLDQQKGGIQDHYHYDLDSPHEDNVKDAMDHFKEQGHKFGEGGPHLENYLKGRKAAAETEAKTPVKKMDGMDVPADVNMAKEEHCCPEDEKADKKMIEEKLDEHNEKKHGEDKDEDSAMKKGCGEEMIKYEANGQWSIKKAKLDIDAIKGKWETENNAKIRQAEGDSKVARGEKAGSPALDNAVKRIKMGNTKPGRIKLG